MRKANRAYLRGITYTHSQCPDGLGSIPGVRVNVMRNVFENDARVSRQISSIQY